LKNGGRLIAPEQFNRLQSGPSKDKADGSNLLLPKAMLLGFGGGPPPTIVEEIRQETASAPVAWGRLHG
jgi:hypothetical protein